MKQSPKFARASFPVIVAAAMWLVGCAGPKDNHQLRIAPDSVYDTAEGLQAMPRCEAVIVQTGPCFVYLKTADGNGFYIGSPAAGAEVWHFLEVLKEGKTYKFPESFLNYQKQRQAGQ